ncbi:SDR family NAD(P)-dependent oxidoreductase [Novosphingobium mangrovi (ex Huang et al. 2023)]|uniref:SDR family oxidoreductase n=1 Tax=Novosphingobium mangrovi (ex Huang et al. 2023) TaxID=2976432 RepID=A0ABT2I8H3_9SPHN|nr:SDR family NAD(P)-dependent oxidoreductase [Novosphingobium mangrovi (ex Huang et al. 2023)]MCT2401117.1 SDR family oxidoreductase [Novosphingobium mangrovi (ex Huang et al. 2023)]
MDFTGEHVIVTGASSGIGLATARRIAGLGGTVTMIARRAAVLEAEAAKIGPAARWITADVGDKAQVIAAMDEAAERSGPIDGLFLNAGIEGMFALTPDYTDEAFEAVMRVNVTSLFWTLRHVLPAMTARGKGAIVVTGSLAAETGMVGNIGYLASKHAALGIARCIAMEAAPHGVRCNVINPGFIDTPILEGVPEEFKAQMAGRVPQKRIGTPDEAANVAAFLLSNDASHVTAQSLAVDGGLLGTLIIEQ